MQLPQFQSADQTLMLLQRQWASILNPLLAGSLSAGTIASTVGGATVLTAVTGPLSGLLFKNLSLATGNNTINHLLGRTYQGWWLVGMHNGFAQVYDVPITSSALNASQNLVLNASAPVSVDLFVF